MLVVRAGPLENGIEELYYMYILYERKSKNNREKKKKQKKRKKRKECSYYMKTKIRDDSSTKK
jgi:hypothetical protein